MSPTSRARKAQPAQDVGELNGTVQYMMGKLEGIENRLDESDRKHARIEKKIDDLPTVIRHAVKPIADDMAEWRKEHTDRIAKLENAAAASSGKITAREKLAAALLAVGTMVATWWGTIHK